MTLPQHANILALSLLATLLGSCTKGPSKAAAEIAVQAQRREAIRVRTEPVERREMIRTLTTTTVVESEKEIEIVPRVGGVVTELHVEEGDAVEEGEVLAVLDQREAEAVLEDLRVAIDEAKERIELAKVATREAVARRESARLRFEQATRDYERNEKAGLISERDLDQSRLERDTASGDLDAAKLACERSELEERTAATALRRAEVMLQREELRFTYTRITAPFTGVIARRMVKVGDTIDPGQSLFVLTDSDNLRAVFQRPQRELPLFMSSTDSSAPATRAMENGNVDSGVDLEIAVRPEALPGQVFRGVIERISPSIDPENGAFRVTARLVQPVDDAPANGAGNGGDTELPRGRLLPGMLVRLDIVTDRHPGALVVPKRATRREGEDILLFVVDEGTARRVRVVEGYSDDDNVEVVPLEGETLTPGDRVVVVGNRDLEEGSEVEEEQAKPAAAPPAPTPETNEGDGGVGD